MLFVVPAVLGILIKLLVLYFAGTSKKSNAFLSFIALLTVHNAAELLLFYYYFSGGDATFSMKIYYSCLMGVLAGMVLYTMELSHTVNSTITKAGVLAFITICIFIVFSDTIISGYKNIDYAITAIKGPYYFLFQVISIACVLCVLTLITFGYRRTDEPARKIKCLYALASLLPGIIIGCGVLILMNLGYNINAMSVFPIGTTLMVLITIKGESKHKITDIRIYLPFSEERAFSQKMITIVSSYSQSECNMKEASDSFEEALIQYQYEKSEHNKAATAKKLGISRSTLYEKLKKAIH